MRFFSQSRSRWPLLLTGESPAYHGEKSTDQISKLVDLGTVQLESLREDFLANCLPQTENPCWLQHTSEFSAPTTNRPLLHTSGGKSSIRMEEFVDLSAYCRFDKSKSPYSSAADELNTPVFELRDPFDFGQANRNHNNTTDILQQQHIDHNYIINIKSESDTVHTGIFNQCRVDLLDDVKEEDSIELIKSSLVTSNNQRQETVMWPMNNDVINMQGLKTPTTITMSYTILDDDDEKLITVNSFNDILNVKKEGPAQTLEEHQSFSYDTPDESTCSSSISSKSSVMITKLKLDIKAANASPNDDPIKTADVIDAMCDMETEKGFNILQFINDDTIQLAADAVAVAHHSTNFEQEQEQEQEEEEQDSNSSEEISANFKTLVNAFGKRPRKKYDSDDDYLPPSEKKPKRARVSKISKFVEEIEDVDILPIKRGRPPKRNVSISSDDYGDSPESRYRELRDKNNEASRRSRLKRKVKEQEYESEANDLEERNEKLKAQVEELEKTVSRFRTNLMTLLLHKK